MLDNNKPFILRSLYYAKRGDNLLQTIEVLITKGESKPEYKPIIVAFPMLREKASTYQQCINQKLMTGQVGTTDRKLCLKDLMTNLYSVFDLIEANCNNNADYILNLGLECHKEGRSSNVLKGVPSFKMATNTTVPGQIDVKLNGLDGATNYGFIWSDDGGATRHNGQYSSTLTATLNVTPHSEIKIWVFALGKRNSKSELSEPIVCRSL
jgi:hypothetical protein